MMLPHRPTAHTSAITGTAVCRLRAIFGPGVNHAKADVKLPDLQGSEIEHGKPDLNEPAAGGTRLLDSVDAFNDR